jgi:hypothetical protein
MKNYIEVYTDNTDADIDDYEEKEMMRALLNI